MMDDTCAVDIGGTHHLRIIEDLQDNDEDVEKNVGRFVWPTALPMMKHIREDILPSNTEDTIIVELGAGCGLLGMGLAATRKFHQVIITDHDDVWLRRNLDLNASILGAEVTAMRLDWDDVSEVQAVSDMIGKTCSAIHDPKLLIVASDVLYNHSSHQKLVHTLRKLSLHGVPTRILIGFLNDRDNDEKLFLSVARVVYGDTFPSSRSIFVEREGKNRSRPMTLHLIDFVIK
jgi:predicted nicotinamide N-methyase